MKKAQASVITTILIILVVLAAIIVVYNVVIGVIEQQSSNIGVEHLTLDLSAQKTEDFSSNNPIEISVSRKTGAGEITALKFIFTNADGEDEEVTITDETCIPGELETKTCTIERDDNGDDKIPNDFKPVDYEVYPIIKLASGNERIGKAAIKEEDDSGTIYYKDDDGDGYTNGDTQDGDGDSGTENIWKKESELTGAIDEIDCDDDDENIYPGEEISCDDGDPCTSEEKKTCLNSGTYSTCQGGTAISEGDDCEGQSGVCDSSGNCVECIDDDNCDPDYFCNSDNECVEITYLASGIVWGYLNQEDFETDYLTIDSSSDYIDSSKNFKYSGYYVKARPLSGTCDAYSECRNMNSLEIYASLGREGEKSIYKINVDNKILRGSDDYLKIQEKYYTAYNSVDFYNCTEKFYIYNTLKECEADTGPFN